MSRKSGRCNIENSSGIDARSHIAFVFEQRNRKAQRASIIVSVARVDMVRILHSCTSRTARRHGRSAAIKLSTIFTLKHKETPQGTKEMATERKRQTSRLKKHFRDRSRTENQKRQDETTPVLSVGQNGPRDRLLLCRGDLL